MRRAQPWLLNFSAALSLVMCVATTAAAIRSWYAFDEFYRRNVTSLRHSTYSIGWDSELLFSLLLRRSMCCQMEVPGLSAPYPNALATCSARHDTSQYSAIAPQFPTFNRSKARPWPGAGELRAVPRSDRLPRGYCGMAACCALCPSSGDLGGTFHDARQTRLLH